MEKLDLVSEVIKLDHEAHELIRQQAFAAWMELNLTAPQLKCLFFITRHRGTNSRTLAAALGVTPPNVTGIIDRLVEQGLINRQDNPENRRALMLQATEKGEGILSNLREQRISNMYEILARMSVEELSSLAKGLSALIQAARKDSEEKINEHDRSQKPDQEVRSFHSR